MIGHWWHEVRCDHSQADFFTQRDQERRVASAHHRDQRCDQRGHLKAHNLRARAHRGNSETSEWHSTAQGSSSAKRARASLKVRTSKLSSFK